MTDDPKYCGAKKRQGEGTCTRPAGWGTDHSGTGRCKLHGGRTPSHRDAAVKEQARRDVELFGAKRTIAPAEALLELVHWTAGEVDYWRQRVRDLEGYDLTWGLTKTKTGGDDAGDTEEAKPAIEYAMLVDASNRLERYASSALKAGADAAMVQIARGQGALLAVAIQQSLGGQHDWVRALIVNATSLEQLLDDFDAGWQPQISIVVPPILRGIGSRSTTPEGA